jgi:hypothetical protein
MDSGMDGLGLPPSSPGSRQNVLSYTHQSQHHGEDHPRPTPNESGNLTMIHASTQSSSGAYAVGQAAQPSLALRSRPRTGDGGKVTRFTNSRARQAIQGFLGVPVNTLSAPSPALSSPGHLMASSSLSASGAASPPGQDRQVAALASETENAHQTLQQQNDQAYGMVWDLVSTLFLRQVSHHRLHQLTKINKPSSVGDMSVDHPDDSYASSLSTGAHDDLKSTTISNFENENGVSFQLQNSTQSLVLFAPDSADSTWDPNVPGVRHPYLHDLPTSWNHSCLGVCESHVAPESPESVQLLTDWPQSRESRNYPHHLPPAAATTPSTPWNPEGTLSPVETGHEVGFDTILVPPLSPVAPKLPHLDTTYSGSVLESTRSSSEETQTVFHRCEHCFNIFETQSALK